MSRRTHPINSHAHPINSLGHHGPSNSKGKTETLDGRIAAVADRAGRGLGRAVVDELLRQGCATVVACARNVDSLAELENVVAVSRRRAHD